MVVDCHIHGRDLNERHKETVAHALDVAYEAGVDAVFAMPNTDPPITTEENVRQYLNLAREEKSRVFFGVYMGLTKDPQQVKRAVENYRRFFPSVVGFKIYLGKSTNPSISVTEFNDQSIVYDTLAREGYDGVVSNHAEKEKHMDKNKFDPNSPVTHAIYARPEEAEIESIKDLIKIVSETGYRGKTHIAHISSPKAVQLVSHAKAKGLDFSCGVCPHHLVYDWEQMQNPQGLWWKMNPPLRSPGSPNQMLQYLRQGKIDWIETDHAPHTLADKNPPDCASGVPALHAWPLFLEFLRSQNFNEREIEAITHENVIRRFAVPILSKKFLQHYSPEEYDFNPWTPLEERLGWKSK